MEGYQDELRRGGAAFASIQEYYSDEVGRTNAAVAAEVCDTGYCQRAYEPCPDLPDDLAPIDDAFLGRIRGLASFI